MARQDVTYFFCWGITASAKRQHGRLARTPSTSPAPSNGSVRPCLAPPSDVAAIFPSLCPHSGYRYHRCYCFYNTLYAIQTIRHGRSLSPPTPGLPTSHLRLSPLSKQQSVFSSCLSLSSLLQYCWPPNYRLLFLHLQLTCRWSHRWRKW